MLALGNPDRSLPNATNEVNAVAQLYNTHALVGNQATESAIYTQAAHIDMLHLAAHGAYDLFNPLYSRIELAADESNDGNLEVHEVYRLDLDEASLVVLSACETALGGQSAGDEIVGLTRAFLYAGAPSVVTTLWTVDDAAASRLMHSFYENLQTGQTTAEALRRAQQSILAEPRWQMPYYWAAFTLTGDYLGGDD
jgi:CHAT domain-containing protein